MDLSLSSDFDDRCSCLSSFESPLNKSSKLGKKLDIKLDPGFKDFLQWARSANVPVIIKQLISLVLTGIYLFKKHICLWRGKGILLIECWLTETSVDSGMTRTDYERILGSIFAYLSIICEKIALSGHSSAAIENRSSLFAFWECSHHAKAMWRAEKITIPIEVASHSRLARILSGRKSFLLDYTLTKLLGISYKAKARKTKDGRTNAPAEIETPRKLGYRRHNTSPPLRLSLHEDKRMVHMQSKSRDIPTMAVWLLFLIVSLINHPTLAGQAWGVMLEQDLARAAAPLAPRASTISLLLSGKNLEELRSTSTSDGTIDGSSERTSEEDERSEGKQLSSSPLQPSPSLNSKVGGGGIPDNNVESRKPRVCPICGGGYDKQRPRYYLPCKGIHGHHEECIYGWLSRRLGCPLCQSHQLIISGWGRQLLPVVPQQMTKQQQGPSLHGRADDIPSLQNMPSSSGGPKSMKTPWNVCIAFTLLSVLSAAFSNPDNFPVPNYNRFKSSSTSTTRIISSGSERVVVVHAPAKRPSKLHMFAYAYVVAQSLCSLHSDCASKLG
ncbi:ring finger domain protein [Puccinia sorghi]|uniref:Ring finger domain protein n=1 Tax=Puccinia sorghi TaxID=27349 RepID=A0A0L6VDP0_9BASI|nr:ring finger domain protein [Puccinia sorghi]